MVKIYVSLIMKGLKKIEDVHEKLRAEVEEELNKQMKDSCISCLF